MDNLDLEHMKRVAEAAMDYTLPMPEYIQAQLTFAREARTVLRMLEGLALLGKMDSALQAAAAMLPADVQLVEMTRTTVTDTLAAHKQWKEK